MKTIHNSGLRSSTATRLTQKAGPDKKTNTARPSPLFGWGCPEATSRYDGMVFNVQRFYLIRAKAKFQCPRAAGLQRGDLY